MSALVWPSSPLDAAQRAFILLVQPPSHVGFDGRGFAGLPDEILPLDQLKDLLLSPATGVEVRDAVWRELVTRARRDGPAWVVAAVGLAMPGLRRIAGLLAAGWRGDTDDLDSELIVGFVARLTTVDLDVPRICGRLIDAGLRAARKARDAESDAQLVHVEAAGPIAPIQPWDHPELVLARAVAAAVLDADEANLIAATRLDNATLAQAAARLGIAPSTAGVWRANSERRLAVAIAAGELAFIPLRPRQRAAVPKRPDALARYPLQVPAGAPTAGFWLLAATGLVLVLWHRPSHGLLLAAILATGPALALAGIAPFTGRLVLWLVPVLLLTGCLPVHAIIHSALSTRRHRLTWLYRAAAATTLAAICAGAAVTLHAHTAAALPPLSGPDRVDDRAATIWLKRHHRTGDLTVVTVSSIPAIRWYARTGRLTPGWYVRPTPPGPDCQPTDLATATHGYQRVLAYSGIRTLPTTPHAVHTRLTQLGTIIEQHHFDTGVIWVIDLTHQPTDTLPEADDPTPCLRLYPMPNPNRPTQSSRP